MSERAPYSRIYWSVVDDPKFIEVYDDDRAWALWTRLLMAADQSWPASPNLPLTTHKRSLEKLTSAEIVDLVPGGRYRIRGLDAERNRRKSAATRDPDGTPPGPNRGAVGFGVRPLDETRREKTSRDENARETNDDGRADLETFLMLKRRAPSPKQRRLLDEVMDRHDINGPAWAADLMLRNPDDPIGAVIEADKQWRAMRIAEAQAAEKPTPKPRRKGSGLTGINAELASYFADLEQKRKHDSDAA